MAHKKYATEEEQRLAKNERLKRQRLEKRSIKPPEPVGRPWMYTTTAEAKAAKAESYRYWRDKRKEFEQSLKDNGQDIRTILDNEIPIPSKVAQAEPMSEQEHSGQDRRRKYADEAEYKAMKAARAKLRRDLFKAARKAAEPPPTPVVRKKGGRPRKYKDKEEYKAANKELQRQWRERQKLKRQSAVEACDTDKAQSKSASESDLPQIENTDNFDDSAKCHPAFACPN